MAIIQGAYSLLSSSFHEWCVFSSSSIGTLFRLITRKILSDCIEFNIVSFCSVVVKSALSLSTKLISQIKLSFIVCY